MRREAKEQSCEISTTAEGETEKLRFSRRGDRRDLHKQGTTSKYKAS